MKMGVDVYGLVRQPDGTLGQTVSDETRAAIAQIIVGIGQGDEIISVADVRLFDEFQSNRVSSWEDSERAYEEWKFVNDHAFWWALDSLDILLLGRCTSEVRDLMFDYGVEITQGRTEDKRMMTDVLTVIFDRTRANQLVNILDGLFWS